MSSKFNDDSHDDLHTLRHVWNLTVREELLTGLWAAIATIAWLAGLKIMAFIFGAWALICFVGIFKTLIDKAHVKFVDEKITEYVNYLMSQIYETKLKPEVGASILLDIIEKSYQEGRKSK